MADRGPFRRAREELTGVVSVLVTGIWLAALVTGQDWWLGFMLFGYIVIVPLVALLFGDDADVAEWWEDEAATDGEREEAAAGDGSRRDALETLRDRYARGELTDEQFERKLDRLLDTETIEDAEERARASREREAEGTESSR